MNQKADELSKDRLVSRYTNLLLRFISIPHGINWISEYEDEEKSLKAEMLKIRKELGI